MIKAQVKKIFAQEFGSSPRLFAAPGRINLIGEHTDYNNGFVLPASIDKRIYLAIAPNQTEGFNIVSTDFNERVSFTANHNTQSLPHWARYPFGVIKEMQKLGCTINGFNAVFGGDIPAGAGLSSSAALESAFAIALNELNALNLDKFTLAKVGQSAEHNYVGVRCGIMDQFASIFGKDEQVVLLDCQTLEHRHFPLHLNGHKLILTDTQVKHSLASSEYNKRRAECEEGVRIAATNEVGMKSLRDATIKQIEPYRAMMGEQVYMRCEYVIEENERVLATCKALSDDNLEAVGALMYQSHQGLQHKYQVSCAELDCLVDAAKSAQGVLGSRMMGGGFGGCTISLVKESAVEAFKKSLTDAFGQQFNRQPIFYDVTIGNGAGEVTE